MKVLVVSLLFVAVSVSQAEDETKKREERHLDGIFRKFGGYVKNARCRLRHYKTRLDRNGRRIGCTRWCSHNEEQGYDIRYGHTCRAKTFPKGCADSLCLRCVRGYYTMSDSYFGLTKCVETCPEGYAPQRRRCVVLPHGCKNAACTQCEHGHYAIRRRYWQKSECVEDCPFGYGLNEGKTRCVACRRYKCEECRENARSCSICEHPFYLLKSSSGNRCVRKCPSGYFEDFDESMNSVCTKEDTDEDEDGEEETEETMPPPVSPPSPSQSPPPLTSIPPSSSPSPSPSPSPSEAPLPSGCADRDCLLCLSGYSRLFSTGGAQCLRQCPDGYYSMDRACIRCNVIGCKNCKTDFLKCSSCLTGFAAYKESDNSTLQCLSNCPLDKEKKVIDGQLTCVPKAKQECSVENCKECVRFGVQSLHKGCVRCEDKFYLKRDIFADRCVLRCPSGYYEGLKPGTDINACLECNIPFCTQCVSAKKCFRCMVPFVISPKTGLCSVCGPNTTYDPIKETCNENADPVKATTEPPSTVVIPPTLPPGEEP